MCVCVCVRACVCVCVYACWEIKSLYRRYQLQGIFLKLFSAVLRQKNSCRPVVELKLDFLPCSDLYRTGNFDLPNQFPSFLYFRRQASEKWGWRGRGPICHDIF